MIKSIKIIHAIAVSLLLLSGGAFAQAPWNYGCGPGVPPDVCGAGGSGGQGSRNNPPPEPTRYLLWIAVAIDAKNFDAASSGRHSDDPFIAQEKALQGCGLDTCKVVLLYEDTCGSVYGNLTTRVWAVGKGQTESSAERQAKAECERKSGGRGECIQWVPGECAYRYH